MATFIFPYFVDITANLSTYINIDVSDILLVSIFIGVISGIVNGLIYKSGFSSGGTSVISHILYKYYKLSRTTTSFMINGVLVFLGGFFFGWEKAMCAIIILYLYKSVKAVRTIIQWILMHIPVIKNVILL